jgi:hypothetical protein
MNEVSLQGSKRHYKIGVDSLVLTAVMMHKLQNHT